MTGKLRRGKGRTREVAENFGCEKAYTSSPDLYSESPPSSIVPLNSTPRIGVVPGGRGYCPRRCMMSILFELKVNGLVEFFLRGEQAQPENKYIPVESERLDLISHRTSAESKREAKRGRSYVNFRPSAIT